MRKAVALPKPSFAPITDAGVYGDVLRFEERLKSNAASLQKRKSHYQLFLIQLLLSILFLLSEVLRHTRLLAFSYAWVLSKFGEQPAENNRIFAGFLDVHRNEEHLHSYVASGLLLVTVTTLVLFFASGTYSEKIAYANQYVPHANRALRSFNMYLNVRQPPLRSKYPSLNPIRFLFPRPPVSSAPSSPTSEAAPHRPQTPEETISRSSSRSSSPITRARGTTSTSRSTAVPLAPIPPTTNPRGELIFSSRVDRTFRTGYERYRDRFERMRAEKLREDQAGQAHWWCPWRKPIVAASSSASSLGHGLQRPGSAGGTQRRRTPGGSVSRSGTPGSISLSGITEGTTSSVEQRPHRPVSVA